MLLDQSTMGIIQPFIWEMIPAVEVRHNTKISRLFIRVQIRPVVTNNMAIVYIHKRKDNNQIFYVGIGKSERRVYCKDSRKHARIIKYLFWPIIMSLVQGAGNNKSTNEVSLYRDTAVADESNGMSTIR